MKQFREKIQNKFNEMCQTGKLFKSNLTGHELWEIYLKNTENTIFRDPDSTVYKCNHCNNFIRRYGNIVSLDEDYNIITLFDVEIEGEYQKAASELSIALKNSQITEVFFETFNMLHSLEYEKCKKTNSYFKLGVAENFKKYSKEEVEKFKHVEEGIVYTFNHFSVNLPAQFVDQSGRSVESIMGEYRDSKNVFQRALQEIPLDTLVLVRDLINQGSLLDGTTHLYKVEHMIQYKTLYEQTKQLGRNLDNWCWDASYKAPLARFRNELIGVLCVELAEGLDLNEACQNWNKRVDPANYMKATAPITKKQIEEAKKFVEENGYEESFDRRFATIDDIKASEILHVNSGDNKLQTVSIFDNIKPTSTKHKQADFDKIETVSIDKFMKDILPGCTSIEAFLENRMEGNMVSLTTANNPDSKPIFKWSNNYSWTFNGNLAGKSQIKEEVKSKGGKVDGVLRFSGIWGDNDGDHSDLDMWCLQPDKNYIGFNTRFRKDSYGSPYSACGGQLDLDDRGRSTFIKVENIYFRSLHELKDGTYKFWVNQYSARNSKGFKAEIEFNGELYSYTYDKPVRGEVHVAEVTLKNGKFTIIHKLPCTDEIVTREIYGVDTNRFHKVNLVCLSPNHWGDNNVGNKHYMFMLENATCPNSIRSFHNENLIPELTIHRKVLEVLGNTSLLEPTTNQLSGLGFNSTVKDELVVKLLGSHKRIVKIQF